MKVNMVQALNLALDQAMKKNENVVLLGEDVGVDGGVFRVSDGLLQKYGPERVVDTPLAEAALVGSAIGMAAYGLRPIVEIQFMGFMLEAYHQIVAHAARLRNRTRGRFAVPLVIRMPYGAGVKALEHHSESTEALFCHIPGLKVVVPATPLDAAGLLTASIRDDDPVVFLEPKRLYRAGKQEIPDTDNIPKIPLGKAQTVREGEDLTLITWGAMVPAAEDAADHLEEKGIYAEVLDLRTLAPMDYAHILESVRRTGKAVIVHEAPRTCGLGAEIAAVINEKALDSLEAPVLRVTGQDITVPLAKREEWYYPSVERILHTIKKLLEW